MFSQASNTETRTPKTENQTKTAMRISVVEGIFAQIHSTMTGIGSAFITKTAVLLGATPLHFSFLTGISQLTHIFQLYAVKHNQGVTSRKKPCVQFAFVGRLLSILLGASFAIASPRLALVYFLSLLFVSVSLQTISSNMWVAWMSDLIPKQFRGRFFSVRMQIHLLFGLVVGYLCSFMIDLFEATEGSWRYSLLHNLHLQNVFQPSHLPIGLSVIFVIGASLGLYGLKLLNNQPERERRGMRNVAAMSSSPPQNPSQAQTQNAVSLLEPIKNKDFRTLLRFGIWWMLAIGVGSAFWGPFMLQTLRMSLVEMQVYSMLGAVGMLVSYRFWGRFIDKFGNKTAMKICVFLGGINPLMWLFLKEGSYSLIYLEAFTSGVMWSGANLIAFNFVLAIAPRGSEQHWSAVYSAIGGVMMLTSILLCGIFFPRYPITIGNLTLQPAQILFALTGILRLSAEIPLHFVNEPKAIGLRQTIGFASDYVWLKIMRFKDMMFKIMDL